MSHSPDMLIAREEISSCEMLSVWMAVKLGMESAAVVDMLGE